MTKRADPGRRAYKALAAVDPGAVRGFKATRVFVALGRRFRQQGPKSVAVARLSRLAATIARDAGNDLFMANVASLHKDIDTLAFLEVIGTDKGVMAMLEGRLISALGFPAVYKRRALGVSSVLVERGFPAVLEHARTMRMMRTEVATSKETMKKRRDAWSHKKAAMMPCVASIKKPKSTTGSVSNKDAWRKVLTGMLEAVHGGAHDDISNAISARLQARIKALEE